MTFEPDNTRSRRAIALSRQHMPTDYEISLAASPHLSRMPERSFGG